MHRAVDTRLPALFIGHGSPMNALEQNRYTETWGQLAVTAPRPEAVLCISAHWYVPGTAVTAMAQPRTIHDFYGFPRELHEVRYPAAGDPALARRIQQLLKPLDVALDQDWGLDHGSWSVLTHMFAEADVPVIQLSIDASQPARFHYALGRSLAPLREAGVMIVGSGNAVHNLRLVQWRENAPPYDWATEFNGQVRACVLRQDHAPLVDYQGLGDAARLSVPTPEHYLPLLYVLGAQMPGEPAFLPTDGIELGSVGMLCVQIGGDLAAGGQ